MRRAMMVMPVATTSGYTTQARAFDGTSDYAVGTLPITENHKTGLLSFWLRLNGGDGATQYILLHGQTSAYMRLMVVRYGSNQIGISGKNSADTVILASISSVLTTAGPIWRHVLASWDLAQGKNFLYVDDLQAKTGSGTQVNDGIGFVGNGYTWGIGAGTLGAGKINGDLSEMYFSTDYLDLSVEANRRKFRSAAGKPVSLGANGELPTGNQPVLYLPYGDPANNVGSGPDFTVTGALSVSTKSPSDAYTLGAELSSVDNTFVNEGGTFDSVVDNGSTVTATKSTSGGNDFLSSSLIPFEAGKTYKVEIVLDTLNLSTMGIRLAAGQNGRSVSVPNITAAGATSAFLTANATGNFSVQFQCAALGNFTIRKAISVKEVVS